MKIKFILFALSLISLNANAQQYNYDVNQDGKVTVSDVMLVVNKILGNDTEKPRYPLTISVSEKPIVDANAPASSKKKTPETTIKTLKEFYMNYTYKVDDLDPYYSVPEQYTHKVESTGKWIVGNSEEADEGYWPTFNGNFDDNKGSNVTFYAYANVNITQATDEESNAIFFCEGGDISKPYIDFKLEENSGATKDFLVSQTTDNWDNCQGHLSFKFSHACAAAQFFLIKSDRLASVEVTNVILHNVLGEGEYFFNSGWESLSHLMTFTLWDSKSGKITVENSENPFQLSVAKDKDHDYFFFIPQSFTGWSPSSGAISGTTGSYLEIVCQITDKNGDTFGGTAYLPFATSSALVAGKAYPVTINMNTNLRDANGNYILNANGTIANSK